MYIFFCDFINMANIRNGVHIPSTFNNKCITFRIPLQWHLLQENILFRLEEQLLFIYCGTFRSLLLLRLVHRRIHIPKYNWPHNFISHYDFINCLLDSVLSISWQDISHLQDHIKYRFHYTRNSITYCIWI